MKKYDVLIIGFGKAGKTLALELANSGRSVALIERSDSMYGGTCINTGCIPTKALIHKAELAATGHPLSFEQRKVYYRDAIAAKDRLTASLRELNYRKLADNERIDVYTGEGRFLSPQKVEVTLRDGERLELSGERIVIDTGAETVIPPIAGLIESKRVYTSASVMELTELPPRLTIVGGGYIGLEFASMYAAFGSQVTVLEGFGEFIPREDRDIADSVRQVLEKKGIVLHLDARADSVRDTPEGVVTWVTDTARNERYEVTADALLLATGRRPATAGLNLEAAGVATDQRGAIVVDAHLHTTSPHIYAAGDVTGGLQFTYISLDDYRIIRDDLLGKGGRSTSDRGPVPYSVFISPVLSHVGLHEAEARKAGRDIRVNRIQVAAIPRARILDTTEGMLKAVIDAQSDRVLGCTLFGPGSSEAINTVALAIRHGVTARELSGAIYTHPSMSETLNDLFA